MKKLFLIVSVWILAIAPKGVMAQIRFEKDYHCIKGNPSTQFDIIRSTIVEDTFAISASLVFNYTQQYSFLQLIWSELETGDTIKTVNYHYPNRSFVGQEIKKLSDGNYLIYLSKSDYTSQIDSAEFTKIDAQGNIIWQKSINLGTKNISVISTIEMPDKSFTWVGFTQEYINNIWQKAKGIIVHIDSVGNVIWYKEVSASNRDIVFNDVIFLNNEYLTVGYDESINDNYNVIMTRVDATGTVLQTKTISNSASAEFVTNINMLPDGNLILTGEYVKLPFSSNVGKGYILKIKPDLTVIKWDTIAGYGSNVGCSFYDFKVDTIRNEMWGVGELVYYTPNTTDAWLVKMDTSGSVLYKRVFDYPVSTNAQEERFWTIVSMPDGGAIMGGSCFGQTGTQDAYLVRVDSMGCLVENCWLGVEKAEQDEGKKFSVYPNPTNGKLEVNTKEEITTILVYNMQGQEVIRQYSNHKYQDAIIDLIDFPDGMYLIQVHTDSKSVFNQKIIKQ